jgi:hypothetical protein
MTGTLHVDLYTLMIICRSVLRMRNVSEKSCREYENTHFMFSDFFRKLCRVSDNVEKYGRARHATGDIIRRMRVACFLTKAANAPQCYVHAYIACLVFTCF